MSQRKVLYEWSVGDFAWEVIADGWPAFNEPTIYCDGKEVESGVLAEEIAHLAAELDKAREEIERLRALDSETCCVDFKQHQAAEIASLRAELAELRERERKLVEVASDPGYNEQTRWRMTKEELGL